MQLIDIFRARVVDVSDRSLTVAVTGDAGKVWSRPYILSERRSRLQSAGDTSLYKQKHAFTLQPALHIDVFSQCGN